MFVNVFTENVTTTLDLHGSPYQKDGVTYANITDFKFNFDTTLLKIRLENLFNGNKELSTCGCLVTIVYRLIGSFINI